MEQIEKEIWKDVKGYEGLYIISNYGHVASLDKVVRGKNQSTRMKHGKIMTPIKNKALGYYQIRLYDEHGQFKLHYLHRLVADAFLYNPEHKPQINHKNEDRGDNRAKNLEWVTQSENLKWGGAQERRIKSRYKKKIERMKNELNTLKRELDELKQAI